MTELGAWMRAALECGTTACALWRGLRDEQGQFFDLELVECDEGFARWAGSTQPEMLGMRYSQLVPTGVADRLGVFLKCLHDERCESLVFEPVAREGRAAWAELRITPCGEGLLYVQTFDVTARERKVRAALSVAAEAEKQLARVLAAVNASPDAFAVYGAERDSAGHVSDIRILFVNDAAAEPTGLPSESWRNARLLDFYPEAAQVGLYDRIVEVLDRHEPTRLVLHTDSTRGWHGAFENLITPFGPDLALITWRPEEIAAAKALTAPPAGRDALTGVLSRSGFMHEFDRLAAAGETAGAILQVIDIDDFGHVNDAVGRHSADTLLAQFAADASLLHPRPILVGRIGPDEFAMLFAKNTVDAVAARFARELVLLARLAKTHALPSLFASSGLAALASGDMAEDALRDCDTALRAAVAAGGGRVKTFTPELRNLLLEQAGLHDAILHGLNGEEFVLALQPIVYLDDSAAWGAEALVRWRHPVRGLLQPDRFISAAESSGLIVELGAWVMDAAIAHLAEHPELAHLSINVSSRQIQQDDVPNLVARALERHHVAPGRVVVEITESMLLPDATHVRDQIQRLRRLGVKVALDDFGSGYSSVAYLDRLPVDIVKLDAYFLDGELTERRRVLVASTASMVRALGAVPLIEHVETPEQLMLARDAGVALGQGYLFGAPELA